MSFKFAVPLYAKILIGMLAGVLIGIAALTFQQTGFVNNWVRPWGQVFIRLLQLIAVPLVFVSLVKGVIGLSDIGKFSRIGIRTIILLPTHYCLCCNRRYVAGTRCASGTVR